MITPGYLFISLLIAGLTFSLFCLCNPAFFTQLLVCLWLQAVCGSSWRLAPPWLQQCLAEGAACPIPLLCSGSTRALLPPWAQRHLQPDTHCPSDCTNDSTWDNTLRALKLLKKRERFRWVQGQGPNVFAQHHCTTQCICGVSVLLLQDKATFNSFNGITLLPGFVSYFFFLKDQIFKFSFFARAETSKIFFIKQTQASYKTTELMDVNLAY